MAQVILNEASGKVKELYGEIQFPLASVVVDMANQTDEKSMAKKIFTERKSNNSAEAYSAVTAIDSFQPVGENGKYPTGGFESGNTKVLTNMTFKGSFAISREAHDDIKVMDLKSVPQAFFSDYYRKRENFFAGLLMNAVYGKVLTMNGFSFDTNAADGAPMFSKAHPMKVKKTAQSNLYADAFSANALGGIATAMQNVKDDDGNVMSLVPDTIIIPNLAALKQSVFAVIGSNKVPGSGNNDYNYLFENWNVIVWPFLNNFLMGTDAPYIVMDSAYNQQAGGAIYQNRVDLEIRDDVGDNDEYLWKGYSRFTGGFNDFRAAFVGGVTGGSTL